MSRERRQHERVSIFAQVQLTRDHEVDILNATNLSMGGAFLEASPEDHAAYEIGARFEMMLSLSEEAPGHPSEDGMVHALARIVRRVSKGGTEPAGLGVIFEKIDGENVQRLKLLLSRAKQD